MKKILISSLIALTALAGATSATYAYFSSKAQVLGNTVSTGTLEIRVNGQPTKAGVSFTAAAPGDSKVFNFNINNANQANFGGQSNLTAKYLRLSTANANDFGSGLWSQVVAKVEVNRGWDTWHEAYVGPLSDLGTRDLLAPRWTELAAGSTEDVRVTLTFPDTFSNQNAFMGKTLNWDFVVEGRTQ